MQKDKHNIYSKEELLKLIKEGKSAPADMDEFDLEAMEGLKMLQKPELLNELNKEVDKIVIVEKKKEKQRKAIYYFSAAASLVLLVGLIFFFKNTDAVKDKKVVAEAETKPKEESTQLDLPSSAQAETSTTYEAKEPEQEKPARKQVPVLAEAKQQAAKTNNIEQTISVKTEDENKLTVVKDKDAERDEQAITANQSVAANSGVSAISKETQDQEENKNILSDKAKKEAAPSQPSLAFESSAKNNDLAQALSAPKADTKNEEEKAQPDMFFAKNQVKSKAIKNFKEASYIGGDSALAVYVKQNLKISSPANSGIIVVEFVVNKNGIVENIKVLKPVNGCDACSKDAIDLVKSIKKWQPATEDGKAVSAPKRINLRYN